MNFFRKHFFIFIILYCSGYSYSLTTYDLRLTTFSTGLTTYDLRLTTSYKDTAKPKADSSIVKYFFKKSLDSSDIPTLINISRSLTGFQIYDPVRQHYLFPHTLGNMGMASKNLIFSPSNNEIGFDAGMHSFDPYMFADNDVRYYQVRSPFTEISSVLGAKKEQMIEVKHYQNIKKLFNVGIDYRVIGSLGEYTRERADINSFIFSGSYMSKDHKYSTLANLIMNRIRVQENGGVLDSASIDPHLLNNINLNNAQNHIRQTEINIKQYYRFGKHVQKKDSLSTNNKQRTTNNYFDPGTVSYSFSFSRQYQAYVDLDINANYYPEAFFSTTAANDSIVFKKFTNTISWSPSIMSHKNSVPIIRFWFNLSNQYIYYFNKYYLHQDIYNLMPSAGFATSAHKLLSLSFNAAYANGNYNKSDYSLQSSLTLNFNRLRADSLKQSSSNRLTFVATLSSKTPDYTYNTYFSDFYIWTNNFNKTSVSSAGLSYLFLGFDLGVNYYNIGNYLYFSENHLPAQFTGNFSSANIYLCKNLAFKSFSLNSRLMYQTVGSSAPVHMPGYLVYGSAFFRFHLFHKIISAQAGTDFWYSSPYYGDEYFPATRSFYYQNSKRLGENISIDPFFNIQIKRASLFAKYQRINTLFYKNLTYLSPYYPLQQAAFKFGVLWRFYD